MIKINYGRFDSYLVTYSFGPFTLFGKAILKVSKFKSWKQDHEADLRFKSKLVHSVLIIVLPFRTLNKINDCAIKMCLDLYYIDKFKV